MISKHQNVMFFGLPIARWKVDSLILHIDQCIRQKAQVTVGYLNAHLFIKQYYCSQYRKTLQQIDYLICDGVGISMATSICQGVSLNKLAAGDYFFELFSHLQQEKLTLMLVGICPAVLERATKNLAAKYPMLTVCSFCSSIDNDNFEESLVTSINQQKPDLLLLSLPHPYQEEISVRIAAKHCAPVTVLTGAFIEEVSGDSPRAPRWLRYLYLEWFFRLLQHPRRRWKRYVVGIPLFVFVILFSKLRNVFRQMVLTNQFLKSAIDLILAIVLLILGTPLVCLITCLIKATSSGPIIYKQKRIGYKGKPFYIFKFRTMYNRSEDKQAALLESHFNKNPEALLCTQNDSRITWIGKILRRSGLDEIPQLINVLRGEMSIVGWRPVLDKEIMIANTISSKYQRMKPGITGLWQLSCRKNRFIKKKVLLDSYYDRSWTVLLDIFIVIKSFGFVFRSLFKQAFVGRK